jgi:hypothetical protein
MQKDKKAIYPDSKGRLHVQPIDPETDKEMPGFVQSQQHKGKKVRK